jgi:hypothetical protein
VTAYAIPIPIVNESAVIVFHLLISRSTRGAEIKISPKKKDQIRIGWWLSR